MLPKLTVQKTKLPPAGESGQCSWQWCDIHVVKAHCTEDQVAASRWKWSMFMDDINVAKSPCGESVCCSWQWVEVLIFMAMLLIIRWGKFTEYCHITKACNGGKLIMWMWSLIIVHCGAVCFALTVHMIQLIQWPKVLWATLPGNGQGK